MISLLQKLARRAAGSMGRESALIRGLRPAYEHFLHAVTGGAGVPWEVNGVTYRVDPRRRNHFAEVYDPQVAKLLAERIRPGAVCFDVGANVGIYVLQLAHWSGPDGRVIAFEPNPGARAVLESHIRMNGLTRRVEVVPCAVSARSGEAVFYGAESDGMSRMNEPNRELGDRAKPFPVRVTTLDDYCRQSGVRPDVILIDIEGFEFEALAGADRTIREAGRDLLIVAEMHPGVWSSAGTTRASAAKLLESLQLRAVPLTGQRDPFDDYGQVLLEHV